MNKFFKYAVFTQNMRFNNPISLASQFFWEILTIFTSIDFLMTLLTLCDISSNQFWEIFPDSPEEFWIFINLIFPEDLSGKDEKMWESVRNFGEKQKQWCIVKWNVGNSIQKPLLFSTRSQEYKTSEKRQWIIHQLVHQSPFSSH